MNTSEQYHYWCYRFLITRFLFIFFVSSHQKPEAAEVFAIKEDGTLNIMLLSSSNYRNLPEYHRAVTTLPSFMKASS
jgi:hypothetical protein